MHCQCTGTEGCASRLADRDGLQTQLGFLFLQRKMTGTAVDILQLRKWTIAQVDHEPEEDNPLEESSSPVHGTLDLGRQTAIQT